MSNKYKRKSVDVIATQLRADQSHPAIISKSVPSYGDNNDIPLFKNYIKTYFGEVEIDSL